MNGEFFSRIKVDTRPWSWVLSGQKTRPKESRNNSGPAKIVIPLKNPKNASTGLSMNGNSTTIQTAPPFVLRFSKDERKVFQQNRLRSNEQLWH